MKEKLNREMRRITLKQLRVLEAVMKAGSLSGAAQVLHVTPPAIAMQIRLLESAAGMPLYQRTEHGLRATDGGRELLATTSLIEDALAECGEALETLRGMDGGRVSVGVVSTAKYFAPRALADFAKEHPKVEMQLHIGNRAEMIEALRNYDLDLAITSRPPDDFPVERAAFGNHPHIIIGPPEHPLAGRRQLTLDELADEPFLLREKGSGTRHLMEKMLAKAGLADSRGMEIGSNETIKQSVMAGLGIAFISAHTVCAEIQDGRLAPFDVRGLPLNTRWFVIKRKDKRLLPAAQAVWDFLAKSGGRFLPEIPVVKRKAPRAGRRAKSRRKASADRSKLEITEQ